MARERIDRPTAIVRPFVRCPSGHIHLSWDSEVITSADIATAKQDGKEIGIHVDGPRVVRIRTQWRRPPSTPDVHRPPPGWGWASLPEPVTEEEEEHQVAETSPARNTDHLPSVAGPSTSRSPVESTLRTWLVARGQERLLAEATSSVESLFRTWSPSESLADAAVWLESVLDEWRSEEEEDPAPSSPERPMRRPTASPLPTASDPTSPPPEVIVIDDDNEDDDDDGIAETWRRAKRRRMILSELSDDDEQIVHRPLNLSSDEED